MKYKNIYTGGGDSGETDLFMGGRVKKTDERIICAGKIDTFHAQLGVARSHISRSLYPDLLPRLDHIQNDLISIISEVTIKKDKIDRFLNTTRQLDEYSLRELDHFYNFLTRALDSVTSGYNGSIVYGESGNLATAHFFLASSLSREAEIQLLKLLDLGRPIRTEILTYFNKLSKILYVLALYLNYIE